MNAAFTPGPWLIHAKHRWVVPAEDAFAEPADALPLCQLRDPDARLSEDETLANGFLIAAAPELVDATAMSTAQLMSAAELLKKHGEHRAAASCLSQCDFNRTIIAKARGDQ